MEVALEGVRTVPMTVWFRARSWEARWEAMKPFTPVIRIVELGGIGDIVSGFVDVGCRCWFCTDCGELSAELPVDGNRRELKHGKSDTSAELLYTREGLI